MSSPNPIVRHGQRDHKQNTVARVYICSCVHKCVRTPTGTLLCCCTPQWRTHRVYARETQVESSAIVTDE
eukprot:m.467951 g.467951  ORF g.467951 m.467951 type:complete len:70 (+) comp21642_c1_seq29:5708-5917(+)